MDQHLVPSQALFQHGILAVVVVLVAVALVSIIYLVNYHPISHVPGPFLAKVSPILLYAVCYLGIEGRVLRQYHQQYNTKVLRIAPNSLSISDADAVREIYITGGGFAKDDRYKNFNLGPVVSIFSAIDSSYRDRRAKAVAPLFAPARLRIAGEAGDAINGLVTRFVEQLRVCKHAGVTADIVDLCARLSIDVVTECLLGENYNGLDEHVRLPPQDWAETKLSANPFIMAIVRFSRFSLLPNWLFRIMYAVSTWAKTNRETLRSFTLLDEFIDRVVGNALRAKDAPYPFPSANSSTYQSRLLQAGISPVEVAAQSKAIVFAGADSTAVMLSTALFHLVRNPDMRQRLVDEMRRIKDSTAGSSTAIPSLAVDSPYLRAVIKETLRLGMANPTRLTRVVPATGLRIGTTTVPPGTIVGCAAYILHHDSAVFPDAFSFRPERWLDDGNDEGLHRPGMERSIIAFGAGSRACIGKNLAQEQLYQTVRAVVNGGVLDGATTCQERIEVVEWFNGEIKDHRLEIEWS